jgi:poly(beta-D-mannuronate) lyase
MRGGRWLAIAWMVLANGAASAAACPTPPTAIKDLVLPRFYTDQEGSVIDPELLAEHRAAVEPLTEFLRHVTSHADKALRASSAPSNAKSQSSDAACALQWLMTWAAQDAWLGNMSSKQGEYQRKWDLAGVALAYLKIRPYASVDQKQVIEPWLIRFADAAHRFFDDRDHKRNNHWYWLGLGLAATALATDSEPHWLRARAIMLDAANDIGADGFLPMELDRKSRALQYHAFSLMPLVVLAELGRSRGEDWYELSGGALHRLAGVTMKGLIDPSHFDQRTGVAQERPSKPGAGWLGPYSLRFANRVPLGLPDIPSGHRWLGGDVMLLVQALPQALVQAPAHQQ